MRIVSIFVLSLWAGGVFADETNTKVEALISAVEQKVVQWRRDIHQHPELGNREFRTAALVTDHLKALGLEVTTNVAHTGVVGILRGKQNTPMVALRADMDALPVTELTGLAFASQAKSTFLGQEVGVMHACGHDNHVAMLMGVAQVLANMRDEIPGSVKFIFQPAEEGPPPGEDGGARMMVAEGVLEDVDAIFGLHIGPGPLGSLAYRPGGMMASADTFSIVVEGRQTHGAMPWAGVDPIVVAAQIVLGLQTITSRQLDSTLTPSIVSIGKIQGGVRSNIIPAKVEMVGTIRTFDKGVQQQIFDKIALTATLIAQSAGATAIVTTQLGLPVTTNDADLVALMLPSLVKAAGEDKVGLANRVTVSEDFSYFQQEVPGFYFLLGAARPEHTRPAPNHSPYFDPDERALPVGVRALTYLALDFLANAN